MKWIDVNDHLPPIGVEVLCFRPDVKHDHDYPAKPLDIYARDPQGRFPGRFRVSHWLDMDMPPGWTDIHGMIQHR